MSVSGAAMIEKAIETAVLKKTAAEIALAEKIKALPQNLGKIALAKGGQAGAESVIGNDQDLQDVAKAVSSAKRLLHPDLKGEAKKLVKETVIGNDADLAEVNSFFETASDALKSANDSNDKTSETINGETWTKGDSSEADLNSVIKDDKEKTGRHRNAPLNASDAKGKKAKETDDLPDVKIGSNHDNNWSDTEPSTVSINNMEVNHPISSFAEKRDVSTAEKQEIADKAAQDYNEQYKPYDRAVEKGLEGIKKTDNGGVSFEDSPYIYINDNGDKAVVVIKATGNRSADFDAANAAFGLDKTPDGYVWHHIDDYNVKDGTITLQLVKDDAHNATKPHSGGCAQYDAVNGPSYNPPRKGA